MKRLFLLSLWGLGACADGTGGSSVPGPSGVTADAGGPGTCVDTDEDGFGEGCPQPDCDDGNALVNPAIVEGCNGVDDDCDGAADEEVTGQPCPLDRGVCVGARTRCEAGAFTACDGATYGETFEARETLCDGLDNDCDGVADRDCPCTNGESRECGGGQGACRPGTQTCEVNMWGPCLGEVPPQLEVCNGADDDCDGAVDNDLPRPPCPRQLGVCAGARSTCGANGAEVMCGAVEYGEVWREVEGAGDCDGLDNDCDGDTDEGCTCLDGAEQACGLDQGVCQPGTQLCAEGQWGECRGSVNAASETCDGRDEDCDGRSDESLEQAAPPCPLQAGVCAGAVPACLGAAGWQACGPGTYADANPRYVEVETEAECDGLDNDCDGLTDEPCTCADGDTQVCGANVGACTQGRQTCVGGRFGECDGVGPRAEQCNAVDDDCDGRVDEPEDLQAPACPLSAGLCAGTRERCEAGGWQPCDAETYGPAWQANETFCDTRDNDCDGTTDELCECVDNTVQACGVEEGACTRGQQTCVGGRYGACEGAIEARPETCDGTDEDCDGRTDEAVVAPGCPLQTGVCAGAARRCDGARGFEPQCGPAEYGPLFVAQESEDDCDGRDNDCDGRTDEACECQPGGDRPECGTNTGECRSGRLVCEQGRFGACEGESGPAAEECNGLDDDCDGDADERLAATPCPEQRGVCAGSVQRCLGRAGLAACAAEDYGPFYLQVEGAGDCNNRDDDCDGRVDEACDAPPLRIEEVYYDGPGRDETEAFIEVSGPAGAALGGVALEAIDGQDGTVYARIPLDTVAPGAPPRVMPALGVLLIVDRTASALLLDIADLVAEGANLQNGPDAVRLVWNGDTVLDAVGYGVPPNPALFAGEGRPAPDPEGQSLTRLAGAPDTNDNAVDFVASGDTPERVPTPRGAALPRLHIALRWDTDQTDLDLHLQRPGADFGDPTGDCSYANRRPVWNAPGVGGDPRFERDDTDGLGPEFIDYGVPAPGTYLVQVRYFSDRGLGPSTATVSLFVDGAEVSSLSRRLTVEESPFWAVAEVRVANDGAIQLVPRDLTAAEAFPNP